MKVTRMRVIAWTALPVAALGAGGVALANASAGAQTAALAAHAAAHSPVP